MKRVSGADFEAEVLQADKKVIVDFYSDSCVPCKFVGVELGELEDELEDIKFVKVNTNYEAELVEKYSISSTPTVIAFDGGVESKRFVGWKKQDEIRAEFGI